jgi:hypothetical protein
VIRSRHVRTLEIAVDSKIEDQAEFVRWWRETVTANQNLGRGKKVAQSSATLLQPDELYVAIEDIDHSRTKTKSPPTNGICERFHKTVLNEFYRVAFRKKVYHFIDEL